MLLYFLVLVVVIIGVILYIFFSVLDKLVDDNQVKKESFTNLNDIKEESLDELVEKRGITKGGGKVLPSDTTNQRYRSVDSTENNVANMQINVGLHSPSTVSIPANKMDPVVDTGSNCTHDLPLQMGKYTFPIQKFLYDGVWDRNVESNGQGLQENDWNTPNKMVLEGSYSTDNFIHTPRFNFIDGEKFSKQECVNKDNSIYFDCNNVC